MNKQSNWFLYIVIWITGIAYYINASVEASPAQGSVSLSIRDACMPQSLVMGLVCGIAVYWLGGLLFHGAVKLSGGTGRFSLSRRVYIYSFLPLTIANLCLYVSTAVLDGNNSFAGYGNDTIDAAIGLLYFAALMLVIFLLFKGARSTLHARPVRSMLAFVLMPVLFFCFFVGAQLKEQDDYMKKQISLAVNEAEKGHYDRATYLFEEVLKNNDVDRETKTGILRAIKYLQDKKAVEKNAFQDINKVTI